MNPHRKQDIAIELAVSADTARRLAVMLSDAGRPGHARRMAKVADYLAGLHTLLQVDGELPADLPNKNSLPTNVKRLRG